MDFRETGGYQKKKKKKKKKQLISDSKYLLKPDQLYWE